jgi:uncharacterized protein with von Willebrand factor type A (vWA) domain
MSETLTARVVEFCAYLRTEHGFSLGPGEVREAVGAIDVVGVEQRARVAAALRAVCCGRFDEIEPFDRAFATFFTSAALDAAQAARTPRGRALPARTLRQARALSRDEDAVRAAQTSKQPDAQSAAEAWQVRRARYSPIAAQTETIAIPTDGLDAALAEAQRLIERLHLARSLRWRPSPRGGRFDVRRTLRASLRTGGEVIAARMLDRPLRNPRFVLLLDGSRSMSEHYGRMLQFAYALCRRTRRASVFLFSTKLREVTRDLREAGRGRPYRLDGLGEAWGGGTKIGASLTECVRAYGARLNDQTFVIVMSDGLDVGDIPQLKRAMHDIARRCAAIAWVNPHVSEPGFSPSARGMQAALPYLTTLTSLHEMRSLSGLGRRTRVAAGA